MHCQTNFARVKYSLNIMFRLKCWSNKMSRQKISSEITKFLSEPTLHINIKEHINTWKYGLNSVERSEGTFPNLCQNVLKLTFPKIGWNISTSNWSTKKKQLKFMAKVMVIMIIVIIDKFSFTLLLCLQSFHVSFPFHPG